MKINMVQMIGNKCRHSDGLLVAAVRLHFKAARE